MNIAEIVIQHLIEHGYDGLYEGETQCGCLMEDDLFICDIVDKNCKPGYKRYCIDCSLRNTEECCLAGMNPKDSDWCVFGEKKEDV